MIYAPLWKDVYYQTSAVTSLNYSVRTSDTLYSTDYIVYKGRAYRQPSSGAIQIKLNPIVDKYMGNSLPENWYGGNSFNYSPEGLIKSFYLFDDSNETILESYTFRYTYDEEFDVYAIDYEYAVDNYPDAFSSMTEEQYYSQYPDGFVIGIDNKYNANYPELGFPSSGLRQIKQKAPDVISIYSENGNLHLENPNQWTFNTSWYITQPSNYIHKNGYGNYCKGDMAVYYLGKCGCWNDFLFTGRVVRKDDLTHYDYGTDGYNALTGNPEYSATIIRYANELTTTYECTTGWLDDTNSEYFAQDLVPALSLMVHDLVKDKIYPAIIVDTQVETKKYKNNKQLNQYTVTFKIAKDYYIR